VTAIGTADIHVNDNPRDEYRWRLFDWLLEQKADELILAGDLTVSKDRHSAILVNRLYDYAMKLAYKFRLIIIKGNHDFYVDPNHPFFQFLGNNSDIVFVSKPEVLDLSIGKATFVPSGLKWDFDLQQFPFTFTHATFSGSKAENGSTLTGVDPNPILSRYKGEIWSGDIHVPQTIKKRIHYFGAPYHTRFGDDFDPRVVFFHNGGAAEDLHYPAPRKHVFDITRPEDLADERAKSGDHVKVRCHLLRSEYDAWRKYKVEIREYAESKGWVLFGSEPVPLEINKKREEGKAVTSRQLPEELIEGYAKRQKADTEYLRIGKELLIE
jgi:predicted phosphodiesterase